MNKFLTSTWSKVILFAFCMLPALALAWWTWQGELTANPIEFMTHWTGEWTLRFIVITLSISPLRTILALPSLIRFRRMFGLFAFFYCCLHFATWMGLDKFFDWSDIVDDIGKRPFITVGFLGFVLMIPLAITSTKGMIRRLGPKRWQMLHRLIYVTAIAGVIHYYWLVKVDVSEPIQYAFIVGLLFAWRLFHAIKRRRTS